VLRRAIIGGLSAAASLGVAVMVFVWGVAEGGFGSHRGPGRITEIDVPAEVVADRVARQIEARASLAQGADRLAKQILFGDLHVHTTYSSDAFLFSLPILQGEGAHPPADACDFARYCSALDFWSINDHAELLTPRQWAETRDSIRQCNAVAGDPEDPDLVSFLGWEWTQMAPTPENHYGHKNVILRDSADAAVPSRPIGAGRTSLDAVVREMPLASRVLMSIPDFPKLGPYADFNRYRAEVLEVPTCPKGIDVRELPSDCFEAAETPRVLFEKLGQWGFQTLVIPHGTSWGIHAPPNSSLAAQLGGSQHDPQLQRLFEVYSGHGSSEVHRSWRHLYAGSDGSAACPEPSADFTPCCWRAGELIGARCSGVSEKECEDRVRRARAFFVEAAGDPRRFGVVPGATPEEWGECGQLTGGFLPAYVYRPRMSAQYGLAIGDFGDSSTPVRFRYGLIGSSDNHKARAGAGYKEFARKAMGDAWGGREDLLDRLDPRIEPSPLPAAVDELPEALGLLPERGASFYSTGGLVAVHAEGRHRDAIWDGLARREVYGTSGDRILLWFDLQNGEEGIVPMGGEARLAEIPRFEVRAVGAHEQQPGCPTHATASLDPERLQRLCLGECYHPGDRRRLITRIEVVRIRPQAHPNEPLAALIEDPWKILPCVPDPAGCNVAFEDAEFPHTARETVYYVRAIQEPTPAVNGDPLRCERDERGSCLRARPCYASGPLFDPDDDCLAPIEERAWSSPIFLDPR
jgi:hypothetical protein